MIDPVVRRASAEDIADLDQLELTARTDAQSIKGGPRQLEIVPPRRGRWLEASSEVYVALLDGLCVGYLVGVPGDVWVIESVFVRPEAREVGFGDALLEAAIHSAERFGSRRIEGTALPGDRETKNLYERAGVTAKAITVGKDLNGPSIGGHVSQ